MNPYKKKLYLLFILSGLFITHSYCQKNDNTFLNNKNLSDFYYSSSSGIQHNIKLSLLYAYRKGIIMSAGLGLWQETPSFQYSLNSAFQFRWGRKLIGNYNKSHDENKKGFKRRSQFNLEFSPLLTIKSPWDKSYYCYQEIEPAYAGNANAVFNRYKNSLTIGTTFIAAPQGSYSNVSTTRNRTQQYAVIALNIADFNFTMYDDYLASFTRFTKLGDNWDRYFTGGGFIRVRANDQWVLHVYSEVYTGINRANPFLNPDIINYNTRKKLQNFANQDAGQEYFNSSWLMLKASYSGGEYQNGSYGILPTIDFIAGTTAPFTMFSQEAIHDIIPYDKNNCHVLHFHHFLHRSDIPGNLEAGGKSKWGSFINSTFYGFGTEQNILLK